MHVAGMLLASVAGRSYPAFQTSNNGNSGTSTTTHTVNLPASIASGDLLLVLFSNDGTATATITTPATGWTEIFANNNGQNTLTIMARVANGGEGASVEVTTSASEGSAYATLRFNNWGGSLSDLAVSSATGNTGTTDSPDPDQVSPGWGTEQIHWQEVYGWDRNVTNSAYSSGYGLAQVTDAWVQANGCGIATAGKQAEASTDDPGTALLTGAEDWVACTLAIRGKLG